MYSSIFRDWRAAACLVVGIAALAGAFFADGGGYESLPAGRNRPETAPVPQVATPAVPANPVVSGFTSDAELEAEFAEPTEPAASESAAPEGNASSAPVAVSTQSVVTAAPSEVDAGSVPAEQAR
jgi:hypothetical protein